MLVKFGAVVVAVGFEAQCFKWFRELWLSRNQDDNWQWL